MAIDLNLNTKGEDVKGRSRKEMLVSFYENNFHLIPCGSKSDVIPDYFKRRHQYEEDEVLVKRWSKTPRVKWSNYIEKQPHLKEIKEWYLQFPNCNWAAITGINFVVLDADTQEACDFVESGQITRTTMKQKNASWWISLFLCYQSKFKSSKYYRAFGHKGRRWLCHGLSF